jgi:hypothetical protein
VPESVVGLLLLFAALGPGFVWVRVAERRTAQPERSPLLETAQLVSVGGLCSLASAALMLWVASELNVIDVEAVRRQGATYALLNPLRAFVVLAGAAMAALLLAWMAARLAYRGDEPSLHPGTTWRQVLGAQKDRAAVATLGLRNGRIVQGVVIAYEITEPTQPRDLAIGQPIFDVSAATGETSRIEGGTLLVSESEIGWMSVDYVTPQSG